MDLLKFFRDKLTGKTGEDKSPAKVAAYAVDNYEAATFSRDRSFIYRSNVNNDGNPAPFTRREILGISRYATKNFPLAERILSVTEIYGIGAGLVANAGTADKDFNKAATAAFDQWAGSQFCSSNNQYNLFEMQKLIARELVLAGEVFIVLIKTASGYPQLQLVRSEDVRTSGNANDDSVDGLYMDVFGKITAYNIFSGTVCQKVDASNVIHLIRHKEINQYRGIGSFAPSLNSLRDRADMFTLEKKAIKIHSRIALVVKKQGGELADPLMGGPDWRVDNINESATGPSNRRIETPFGEATVLEPNEDVELMASQRSTAGFINFLELLVREVCLSINLSYEFLVNPEALTGTAVRFVINDAAAFFRDVQDRIIDGALNRIYSWVIASFINAGKLDAPTLGLPWDVSFTRPLSLTVDTTRVTNAEIALLQNSLQTYEGYYSARGKDYKQELRQHAEEERFLDELSRETGVSIARLRALPAGSPILDIDEQDGTSTVAPAGKQQAA